MANADIDQQRMNSRTIRGIRIRKYNACGDETFKWPEMRKMSYRGAWEAGNHTRSTYPH